MYECSVQEHVPIPIGTEMPYYDVRQKARAACASAKRMDIIIPYVPENKPSKDIAAILNDRASGNETDNLVIERALSTPEGAEQVNLVLTAFDMEVVEDARRLRNYVTNSLILESKNMDPRIRIKALELLGKITDVGLFTERTELTVNNKSTQELEASLKDKLRRLMGKDSASDAKIIEKLPQKLPQKPSPKVITKKELEKL